MAAEFHKMYYFGCFEHQKAECHLAIIMPLYKREGRFSLEADISKTSHQ